MSSYVLERPVLTPNRQVQNKEGVEMTKTTGAGGGIRARISKAKMFIDAALLSPETDVGMVKKIIDCLYLLALPFSFDTAVEDNSRRVNS